MRIPPRDRSTEAGRAPTLDALVCASCGDRVQARLNKIGEVPFCPACLERARPPEADDEVGVGD
jgi:hypothetical protein